ncbi:CD82 antigen-like [Sceloporus undulatus]|uniref:CD82 antigen-like n=1 Tax=Sceloporus undulatus TaxID=8520 RepID=UPI001C4A8664|nr:CD82 antigen-like [Sceloporus undulatus]
MGLCCVRITPYVFFFFNHIFFILGALIVGCGVWILTEKAPFTLFLQASSPLIKVGIYVLIGVGGILLLKGFLGCAATLFEIQCFLGLYIICLVLIFAAQMAAGLFVYFQDTTLRTKVSDTFTQLLQTYNSTDKVNKSLETVLDYVQVHFSCCGWTGPENWVVNMALQERNLTYYPCSCDNSTMTQVGFCPLEKAAASQNITVNDWPVRQQGCERAVHTWMEENFDIIIGVSIGLVLAEMLGIVLAFCLCKKKRWRL